MNEKISLASPIRIGERRANNRFVIQPMECCDANADGTPSERTFNRYRQYCAGGAGLVVIESVTLQYESRSTEHQLLLNVKDADNRRAWREFFHRLKTMYPETLLIMQFNHAGEYSSGEFSKAVCLNVKPECADGQGGCAGCQPGAPCQLITEEYVDEVIRSFVDSAEFLSGIGCDGVDLKFCHGYLGSQLLRPANDRNWKYGGSWENRSRFAFDMIEGVRKAVPYHNFLVGAKVSMVEGIPGGQGSNGGQTCMNQGVDLMESILLCKGLEERGADFIIESLGAARSTWELMAPSLKKPDGLKLHLAASQALRRELSPSTVVIGGGLTILGRRFAEVSNGCIHNGLFDMAAIGRQVFADPAFPRKMMDGKLDDINYCRLCDACGRLLLDQKPTWCVFNEL